MKIDCPLICPMCLLQYDERLFLLEQKDQNLPHPTLDLQVVPF
ncbi:hypothetical protein SLEP1_g39576 [Rubroshorea leprosula]|uniref:Trm112 family protein n=1 Tax=Rubroshorea leprosula TaxID=152421 RepID=A0AAV5L111_9ROSI|nr:hypothetical protein SLEP1_g39576 [Rubroshorea leprosula]